MKFQSFARRLTRRVILTTLVTMLAISALVSMFAAAGITAVMDKHFNDNLELTNAQLSAMLSAVEISALNNVDEVQFYLDDPNLMEVSLKSELEINRHLTGLAVGFEPYYYRSKGKWYETYASFDENGEARLSQIGSARHDYLNAEWYRGAMEHPGGYWSDPYFDDAGAKAILCTYSLPVRDSRKRIVGVLAADISLEWLWQQLSDMDAKDNENRIARSNPKDRSYSFIISKDGDYIAHPDTSNLLRNNFFHSPDTVYAEYRELGRRMLAGESGSTSATIDGIDAYVYYAPIRRTDWSIATVVPDMAVHFFGFLIGAIILGLIGIGLLIVFVLCYFSIRRTTRPLKQLARSAGEVAKGNFDTPLPQIKENDEILLLRDSFENMEYSLSRYISQLTDATAHRAALESELNIARDIQMAMLPKVFPPYPERNDIDIYSVLKPAKAVGGDLYDYSLRDGKLFFCIGDVSGKGVPASLVMAVTISNFRTVAAHEDSPARIVTQLNKSLSVHNDSLMFVTLFVGALDLKNGLLQYCNAGHDAPVLIGGQGTGMLPVKSNIAIGIDASASFEQQESTIDPDTVIFLYTDGLTEAEDAQHRLYGEERALECLADETPGRQPSAIVQKVMDSVKEYVGEAQQSDDITLLAIQYRG